MVQTTKCGLRSKVYFLFAFEKKITNCKMILLFSQVLGETLRGGEMCLVNLISGASNYIKALFVTM